MMSPETQEAVVDQAAESSPLACFDEARTEVNRILPEIPDNRLEARRVITREWGLDPTPEELRIIVRVAHDPAGQGGLTRELARAALAARVCVERAVRQVLDVAELDAECCTRNARVLPDGLRGIDALEKQIASISEIVSPDERKFLRDVRDALIPSRDTLVAAGVLAPRLEQLARLTADDDIRSVLPTVTDEEIAVLAGALWPTPASADETASGGPSGWTGVEAILLTAVIREDLAEHIGSAGDDGVQTIEQLERDKIAYHVITDRLQKRRNEALQAGLKRYDDRLQQVKQGLFFAYRTMSAAWNKHSADGTEPAEEVLSHDTILQRLLEESAAQDALADAERSNRAADEEMYRDALGDLDSQTRPATRPDFAPTYDLKRERLRIRVLSAITATLFAGCVAVWATHLTTNADPLAVDVKELSETLILNEAISVGPMMYVVVSHWSWDPMSDEERLSSVLALGLSAANKGYDTVYLVDEARQDLALWSKDGGAQLKQTETAKKNV
jgi:hypothetical protein